MNRTPLDGTILVAVDGGAHGWDALDWAAAEAAATAQELCILHVAQWPPAIDAWAQLPGDHLADAHVLAESVMAHAVHRARGVAPDIGIASRLEADLRPGRAILRAARQASLIVIGRRRDGQALRSRFGVSVGAYVARRAGVPVVIAGLADHTGGPSTGRVAVLLDGHTDAFDALSLAFRAAQRRGIGVTVLDAGTASGDRGACAAVGAFRGAFEDVDVSEEHLAAPGGPALAAASLGAALLVVGARPARHIHRGRRTTAGGNIPETVRTPVVIVPETSAA